MNVHKLQFAKIIGKSEGSIDNYVARGMPGYTPAGNGSKYASVELEVAVPWLLDYQRDELDRARTRLADEQTSKVQLEVRKLRSELLDRSLVGDTWTRLVSAFRSRMLSIPTKLAPLLIGIHEPSIVRDKIKQEVSQALRDLSDEGAFVVDQPRKARARSNGAPTGTDGEPVGRHEPPAVA